MSKCPRRIPWPIVCVVGWLFAIAFGATAAIQHIELADRHLHIEWGNAAEWASGVFGGVAAVAAFGALFYAAREWSATQTERRDNEADQARLIVAQPVDPQHWSPPPIHRWPVVVANHSTAAVFNVDMTEISEDVMVLHLGGPSARLSRLVRLPVLQPGEQTQDVSVMLGSGHRELLDETPAAEYLVFRFTDAHGRRWQRTGSRQPVRIYD
ncbi:hypothetical protein [Mycolicibacterium helvum]|uniref:Uncharacterized protein n=1 Tax=Mycolicibacterium helvum TaxID=1534349 RepID=A0A7I7TGR1_9MYCO|nr:hypothetical protein [Mycolicibacterium helvum]BBY67356.1 hypothetical protein MHEL_55990 [Mycolicibacterium helvum]